MDEMSSERSAEGLRRNDDSVHRTAHSKKPKGSCKMWIAGGALVVVGTIAIATSLLPATCAVERYGQWSSDCEQVLATADAYATPDSQLGKIALIYERGTFSVYSGMRLDQYQRFFTDTPQTLFRVGTVPYVHDDVLVHASQSVKLTIGNKIFRLSARGPGQWDLSQASVQDALLRATDASQIWVDYHSDTGPSRARFGTDGLAQAMQSLR